MRKRVEELESDQISLLAQVEDLKQQLSEAENRANEAQIREDSHRLKKEQLQILAEANTAKIQQAEETIARLEDEKTKLVMGTVEDQKVIIELKQKIESMLLEEQTLRAEINCLKETLAKTTEIVQAPIKMTTREDVAHTIKQGLIAQARLDQALKELEDLKVKYVECVPKTVQDE